MITEKSSLELEYGLHILFDGKRYTLLQEGMVIDYPIGGLFCEFARLHPTEIKDIILKCPGINEKYEKEKVVDVFLKLHDLFLETFPPVMAIVCFVEFQTGLIDWATAINENRVDELLENYTYDENDKVWQFIFEDTPYKCFGYETFLQMALTIYYSFARSFIHTKYMFKHILGASDCEEEQRKKVLDMYEDLYGIYINMQHIDYRIMCLEGKLENLYTIKSALSLLIFEMANAQNTDADFSICPNCNEIFVRDGRSDIVYCTYPSPQNKDKTCREIGAQVARSNKEKTDITTREYRKVYMRLSQQARRHPGDRIKKALFIQLTGENNEWKERLQEGSVTVDEYLEWLKKF